MAILAIGLLGASAASQPTGVQEVEPRRLSLEAVLQGASGERAAALLTIQR